MTVCVCVCGKSETYILMDVLPSLFELADGAMFQC